MSVSTDVLAGNQVGVDGLDEEMQHGVAAAQAGDKTEAYLTFQRVTAQHPDVAEGWVWLGGTSPTLDIAESAFKHARDLDPHNEEASLGLRWVALRRRTSTQSTDFAPARSISGTNMPVPGPVAMLDIGSQRVPAEPESRWPSFILSISRKTQTPPLAVAFIIVTLVLFIAAVAYVVVINWH